jgi:hypothetical protein
MQLRTSSVGAPLAAVDGNPAPLQAQTDVANVPTLHESMDLRAS